MNDTNTKTDQAHSTTNTPSPKEKLWGGRFSESTDQFVEAFTASIPFDHVLAPYDIAGSQAHAKMLAKIGVLSVEEQAAIEQGLNRIHEKILAGKFNWSIQLEDVHMNIEAALTQDLGDVGKKLHTGRSRNDQVATDIRLYLRHEITEITELMLKLRHGLLDLAEREAGTIMPGFTHLQAAQPITFGHHMLAWQEMLKRDCERMQQCQERVNHLPLGSAALAGTTYPIEREFTAQLLGFSHLCENSLDAVSDRDFAIEFCANASILAMHLSRFSEELVIWASSQFDFIELPDRFCTGSSIMPQKKNPDVPELVRGKSGRVFGHLFSLLTLMKSQPLAYNKDNQEDKEPLFDTVITIKQSLRAFAEMIPAISCKRDNMLSATRKGFTTATDLADYLVKKGVPFRDSHEIVGKAVSYAIQNCCDLEALPLEQLQKFSPLIEQDVYAILTLEGSVAARNHRGGTAPAQVIAAVKRERSGSSMDNT